MIEWTFKLDECESKSKMVWFYIVAMSENISWTLKSGQIEKKSDSFFRKIDKIYLHGFIQIENNKPLLDSTLYSIYCIKCEIKIKFNL